MISLFDFLALAAILSWFPGWLHGPDARRLALLFFLLSGGVQFFGFKTRPKSFLWRRFLGLLRFLEGSPAARAGVLAFTALVSFAFLIGKTMAGRFMMFDQGIFNQLMWSIWNGHGFWNTIEAPGNHLLVHFSPMLASLAPIVSWFGFHPAALVVISGLCTWGTALAWMFMVRVHPGIEERQRGMVETGVLLTAVFFDSFWANLFWGFHEAHLAMVLFSWGLYFFVTAKDRIAILFFVAAALCKEIYLLDVGFLLIAAGMIRSRGRELFFLSAILCFVAFWMYLKWNVKSLGDLPFQISEDYPVNLFSYHYGYLGLTGVGDLFRKVLLNPFDLFLRWWDQAGREGRLIFPFALVTSFGGAVFIGSWKRKDWGVTFRPLLLGGLPSFATMMLASDSKLSDFGFQYVLMLWPVVFLVSLPGFAAVRFRIPYAILFAAVSVSFWSGGLDYWKLARNGFKDYQERKSYLAALQEINAGDSVMSDEMGIYLSSRLIVQTPPYTHFFLERCPDWILSPASQSKEILDQVKRRCPKEYSMRISASGMVGYKKL